MDARTADNLLVITKESPFVASVGRDAATDQWHVFTFWQSCGNTMIWTDMFILARRDECFEKECGGIYPCKTWRVQFWVQLWCACGPLNPPVSLLGCIFDMFFTASAESLEADSVFLWNSFVCRGRSRSRGISFWAIGVFFLKLVVIIVKSSHVGVYYVAVQRHGSCFMDH